MGEPTLFSATAFGGTNVTYTWDFGDGHTGSGANVTHTYSAPGSYTTTVTASNSANQITATTSFLVGWKMYMPLAARS